MEIESLSVEIELYDAAGNLVATGRNIPTIDGQRYCVDCPQLPDEE